MWTSYERRSETQLSYYKRDIPAFDTVLFHRNLNISKMYFLVRYRWVKKEKRKFLLLHWERRRSAPAISRRQIAVKIAPVYTCDFEVATLSATKIASSCCDKNRLCKRAFKQCIESVIAFYQNIRYDNDSLE